MPNGAAQIAHRIWEVAQYLRIDGHYIGEFQEVGWNCGNDVMSKICYLLKKSENYPGIIGFS
jgi:hypothetical protein